MKTKSITANDQVSNVGGIQCFEHVEVIWVQPHGHWLDEAQRRQECPAPFQQYTGRRAHLPKLLNNRLVNAFVCQKVHAAWSTINSTVLRVPAPTGLPIIIFG
ncbi:MAG: hypothetical protein ONB46_17810 [candidate division KSB1 bacterium]|nr:hypothetical protein [candidate division KSB1 bacterium]MDZ7367657.1 hypothetical protein [candidate division KSB1 bacterium]MDZ7404828.1 hypothetical protein [candidate division KSB1 bacterium]